MPSTQISRLVCLVATKAHTPTFSRNHARLFQSHKQSTLCLRNPQGKLFLFVTAKKSQKLKVYSGWAHAKRRDAYQFQQGMDTMNMKRKTRTNLSPNLLRILFRGETLEGYIEASRVRTLDQFTETSFLESEEVSNKPYDWCCIRTDLPPSALFGELWHSL